MKFILFNNRLLSLEKIENVYLRTDENLEQYPAIKSRLFLDRASSPVIIEFPSNKNGREAFEKLIKHLNEPLDNVLDIRELCIKGF